MSSAFRTRLLAAGLTAGLALSGFTLVGAQAEAAPQPNAPIVQAPIVQAPAQVPVVPAVVGNPVETKRAADWIAAQWNADSSKIFGGGLADVIMALAASESHDAELKAMIAKLKTNAPGYATNSGAAGKVALAAAIVGEDATNFGGVNLIKVINDELAKDPTGSYSFALAVAVLGLTRNGAPVPAPVLAEVLKQQSDEGAYGFVEFGTTTFKADPDATAIMIMALTTIKDQPGVADALAKATRWAAANRTAQGYWTNFSPVNTTGLMGAALDDLGGNVSTPLAWLKSKQLATGAFASTLNGTNPNLMATTQAILLLAQNGYATVKYVPKQVTPAPSVTPTPSAKPTPSTCPTPSSRPSASSTPSPSTSASPVSGAPTPSASASSPTRPTTLPDTGSDDAGWLIATIVIAGSAAAALRLRKR